VNSFPLVITLVGLITTVLCIPLILGKVRPNRFYGIRTREAFASEENWYRINRAGGKALLPASLIMTIMGLIGFVVPPAYLVAYEIPATIMILASVIITSRMLLRATRDK